MTDDLRQLLKIPTSRLDDINAILIDPDMRVVNDFLDVVARKPASCQLSIRK